MAEDTRTLQLGMGQALWRMPSMVHRMEVVARSQHMLTHGRMYALVAGLPPAVLQQCGLTGNPQQDWQTAPEALLQRPGCTIVHIEQAASAAWAACWEWYTAMARAAAEAMPEGKEVGNDEPPAAETAGA
jgi:hypothetical protein